MGLGTVVARDSIWVDIYGGCTPKKLASWRWDPPVDGRPIIPRVGRIRRYHDAVTRIWGSGDIPPCGCKPVYGTGGGGDAERICGISWSSNVGGTCGDVAVRDLGGGCWKRCVPICGSLTLRKVCTRPATVRVYSDTLNIPRLYLAMLGRIIYFSSLPTATGTDTLTSHNETAGFDLVFVVTFPLIPALVFGLAPTLGPAGRPGNVLGAAHALEQNR